jgi:hypothetical protein
MLQLGERLELRVGPSVAAARRSSLRKCAAARRSSLWTSAAASDRDVTAKAAAVASERPERRYCLALRVRERDVLQGGVLLDDLAEEVVPGGCRDGGWHLQLGRVDSKQRVTHGCNQGLRTRTKFTTGFFLPPAKVSARERQRLCEI